MRGRLPIAILCAALSALPADAYYHYIQYSSRTAPHGAIPQKFDLNTLPNRTVTFFVADTGAPAEGLPSLLNLIREATQTWNGVATSELRVAFGGIYSPGTTPSTPGAEIFFDELDPLTLGLGGPSTRGNTVTGPNGRFIPVIRSTVRLNRDLGMWRAPSFHEAFYLTVVHEMGHALGLQHTFTGSAMATDVTRSTSFARPLEADDIAGLSLLYPARNFAASTGVISGRVTYQGGNQGVHMASVVAIRPGGTAISALTDPDGSYRIEGLAPEPYLLYVHPLPPSRRAGAAPGDIALPVYADAQSVQPNTDFETVFYVNGQTTRDLSQAAYLGVAAGGVIEGANFSVRRRAGPSISPVTTYSFFGNTAVRPGYLYGGGVVVATGAGLAANNTPTPGLAVSLLAGNPTLSPAGLRAYNGSDLILDVQPSLFSSGPRHIVFSLPNDLYVRPFGLNLVADRPPSITAAVSNVEAGGARSVTLAGTDFKPDTRFYFDGVRGVVLRNDDAGQPVVSAPPGLNGLRTVITAFNPDGQNSMFLHSANPPSFTYEGGDAGTIAFAPAALPAGAESMVEITGTGAGFVEGLTALGFGSSDVQVRRLWVLGPTRLLANVWVAPNATPGATTASVLTGFHLIAQPFAFQIQAANPQAPTLSSQLGSANGLYSGATVVLPGANLSNPSITVADRPAAILSATPSQITFRMPAGLTPGPAVLRFSNGSDTVALVVQIEPVPPEIRAIQVSGGAAIDASRPARAGDALTLIVSGLADAVAPSRLVVRAGGIDHAVIDATPVGGQHHVHCTLLPSVAAGSQVPVTLSIDGRWSSPFSIPVR